MNNRLACALLASIVWTDVACAFESGRRPPLEPGTFRSMIPEHLRDALQRRALRSNEIRLINIGNKNLVVMFKDGDTWKEARVSAALSAEFQCGRCSGTVEIAFHNGKQAVHTTAKLGSNYFLSWSFQSQAWVLTSAAQHGL